MFDIGFSELLVIAVVALVVLGPERLPKAARFAGLWVRRARAQWDSVKQELERELQAEELKRELEEARASLQQVETKLQEGHRQLRDEGQALAHSVREGIEPEAEAPVPPAAAGPAATVPAAVTTPPVGEAAPPPAHAPAAQEHR